MEHSRGAWQAASSSYLGKVTLGAGIRSLVLRHQSTKPSLPRSTLQLRVANVLQSKCCLVASSFCGATTATASPM